MNTPIIESVNTIGDLVAAMRKVGPKALAVVKQRRGIWSADLAAIEAQAKVDPDSSLVHLFGAMYGGEFQYPVGQVAIQTNIDESAATVDTYEDESAVIRGQNALNSLADQFGIDGEWIDDDTFQITHAAGKADAKAYAAMLAVKLSRMGIKASWKDKKVLLESSSAGMRNIPTYEEFKLNRINEAHGVSLASIGIVDPSVVLAVCEALETDDFVGTSQGEDADLISDVMESVHVSTDELAPEISLDIYRYAGETVAIATDHGYKMLLVPASKAKRIAEFFEPETEPVTETVIMRASAPKFDVTTSKKSVAGKLEALIGQMANMDEKDIRAAFAEILSSGDTHASDQTRRKWSDAMGKAVGKKSLMFLITNIYMGGANLHSPDAKRAA